MMIQTHYKIGETTAIADNEDIIPLYLKFIPSINEIGISNIDDQKYSDCWIDLNHADYENVYELECAFPWLVGSQAEVLVQRLMEWSNAN